MPDEQSDSPIDHKHNCIWLHAANREMLGATTHLAQQLLHRHQNVTVLLTYTWNTKHQLNLHPRLSSQMVTNDSGSTARSLLQRFNPRSLIWLGGDVMPKIISELHKEGCKMTLVADAVETLKTRRFTLFTPAIAKAVRLFSTYYALDAKAATLLARLGVVASKIKINGPLQQGYVLSETREEDPPIVKQLVTGRPAWMAINVTDRELTEILQAQRVVMRQAHRMLLLIAMRPSDEADQILAVAQGLDLNAALWQTGLEIGQNLDVIMIPAQIDLTSCFRLAPLCFLGQSLFETGQGQSPYQAAALGAAIIVGPFVGAHMADYDRLYEAGGLRRVNDPNELATAVLQMSAPEQAAQTSLAAWTVVSQGAEVTDALTALALDQLGG